MKHRLDVAGLEPLADEVPDEFGRTWVGEHSLDLNGQIGSSRAGSPSDDVQPLSRRRSQRQGIERIPIIWIAAS